RRAAGTQTVARASTHVNRPGVGRAGARRAGTEGHQVRGPPIVAGAVSLVRRTGSRPGARRTADPSDPRGDSVYFGLAVAQGRGRSATTLHPGGGRPGRAPAGGGRGPARRTRTCAAASGARRGRVDGGRGRATGLGRRRRGELRRLPRTLDRRIRAGGAGTGRRGPGRSAGAVRAATATGRTVPPGDGVFAPSIRSPIPGTRLPRDLIARVSGHRDVGMVVRCACCRAPMR